MGICQACAQIAIYISFSITFWCKNFYDWIMWCKYFDLDGPYLVRTDCKSYDAGTVIVVCTIIRKK